nr:immunoglobulin heavy chain junction region [Macaca mulatta]MOV49569.1 immunoglobulin heavy chain junction region [Macaca mulatta]MOV50522.1 immunoglobulin heavy chain junction region [Macaca mulatta]MOV51370.1 immunoglobulin heavy chain junction region [Macaca mulatta]MOV51632.1 immunoglobulin heavy chain junction region [Macaca mulatta]
CARDKCNGGVCYAWEYFEVW